MNTFTTKLDKVLKYIMWADKNPPLVPEVLKTVIDHMSSPVGIAAILKSVSTTRSVRV